MLDRILLKVLIDSMAWLYANQLKLQKKAEGMVTTQDEFERWEDEWKQQTAEIIRDLKGGNEGNDEQPREQPAPNNPS